VIGGEGDAKRAGITGLIEGNCVEKGCGVGEKGKEVTKKYRCANGLGERWCGLPPMGRNSGWVESNTHRGTL